MKDQPDQRFDVAYVPKGAKESVFEIYFSPGTEQFFTDSSLDNQAAAAVGKGNIK